MNSPHTLPWRCNSPPSVRCPLRGTGFPQKSTEIFLWNLEFGREGAGLRWNDCGSKIEPGGKDCWLQTPSPLYPSPSLPPLFIGEYLADNLYSLKPIWTNVWGRQKHFDQCWPIFTYLDQCRRPAKTFYQFWPILSPFEQPWSIWLSLTNFDILFY